MVLPRNANRRRGGAPGVSALVEGAQIVRTLRHPGVGIAPGALPHIFDMFLMNEASMDRPREGLGIGLTLAKRLIELHGGTIDASSAGTGQGSTFLIRLPALADTAATSARR